MVAGGSVRAGAAYVELSVNNTMLMRGMKQAQKELRAFSATVSAWGRDLAKVSAAAIAPLALSAHSFSEFAAAMGRVRGVSGATAEEMRALYEQAKRLARGGAFSAKEIAQGMEELSKRGMNPQQIMAAMESVMRLARITGSDLPTAAEAATGALHAFGLVAGDIGRVVDVMTVAAREGKTDVASIAAALQTAGPAAKLAGASFEDTAAAIATLSANGLKGEAAGTALAMAYKRLSSEAVQKKLAGIGVSVRDARGNMRQLIDVLADVQRKTDKMDNVKRAGVYASIFGKGQVAAMNLIAGAFDGIQAKMYQADGAAKAVANSMGDPLTRSFKRMKAAAEEVRIAIGEAIGPVLAAWFADLARVLGGVRRFITTHKESVVTFMKWALVIGAVAAALIGLGIAGSVMATVIGGLSAIVSGIVAVFTTLATAIAALAVWITTPIGAVIAIFGSFAATMFVTSGQAGKAIGWLRGVFGGLADDAKTAFGGIKDALIAGDFGLAARILWLTLQLEWRKGIAWLTEWWVAFKEVFVGTATDAFYGAMQVWNLVSAELKHAWDVSALWFQEAWIGVKAWFQSLWVDIIGIVSKAWMEIKGIISPRDQVNAAKAQIDEAVAARKAEIEAGKRGQLDAAQNAYNEKTSALAQGYMDERTGIAAERDRATEERHARYQAQINAAQDEVDKAREAWKASIDQAAKGRAAAEQKDNVQEPQPIPSQKKIEQSVPAMELQQQKQMEARGSFSAVAMWGMGVGSTAERTAKAAEATAKNTQRIADNTEDDDATFG